MAENETDDALDDLVFRYLEGVREGASESRILDELCGAHPDKASALRRGVELLRRTHLHPGPAEDGLPERVGPFRLTRRLGVGGMGVVYLAEQGQPRRQVALKLVRPDQLWFEGYRERFTREIESAGRLTHPGIAQIYEMGEHDGVPWFSQEYVVGAPLNDLLGNVPARSPERLTGADLRVALADALAEDVNDSAWDEEFFLGSWSDVCSRIIRQVADALQHAHERGVLHRDVKPSNVLLTPSGRAVLVDFGLASLQGTDRLTKTGAQVGSLHYMPPEQLDGQFESLGPRSDVYSLGVTLYELLTLRAPYSSQSVQRLRGLILSGDPAPPRKLNPAVSRDTEVVCLTAMSQVAAKRYASAAAFAADLSAVLGHQPIAARPTGPIERLARWTKRHPARATAVVAGFLLLVVAPSAFAFQSWRAKGRVEAALAEKDEANRKLGAALDEKDAANEQLKQALEEGNELLGATLEGFDNVVRWTAHETMDDLPWFQEKRLDVIDEGLVILERVMAVRPDAFGVELQRAYMIRTRANILTNLDRTEEAMDEYGRAARVFEQALDHRPDDLPTLRELGSVLYMQAGGAEQLGRIDEARSLHDRALEHFDRAIELNPLDARNHRDFAVSAQALAGILFSVDPESDEPKELLAEGLAAARRGVELAPRSPEVLGALYLILEARSDWFAREDRPREAFEDMLEADDVTRRALALAEHDRRMRGHRMNCLMELGHLAILVEDDAEFGEEKLEEALLLADGLTAEFPGIGKYTRDRLEVLGRLAYARRKAGDKTGGREAMEEIVATRVQLADEPGASPHLGLEAAASLVNLSNALLFDTSVGDDRFVQMLDLCAEAERRLNHYGRERAGTNGGSLGVSIAYNRGAAHNRLGDPEGVAEAVEALLGVPTAPNRKHFFAALLFDSLSDLTQDEAHRERGFEHLETLIQSGFADLHSWEQSEMESEYASYPRVIELGRIVRERAKRE